MREMENHAAGSKKLKKAGFGVSFLTKNIQEFPEVGFEFLRRPSVGLRGGFY